MNECLSHGGWSGRMMILDGVEWACASTAAAIVATVTATAAATATARATATATATAATTATPASPVIARKTCSNCSTGDETGG